MVWRRGITSLPCVSCNILVRCPFAPLAQWARNSFAVVSAATEPAYKLGLCIVAPVCQEGRSIARDEIAASVVGSHERARALHRAALSFSLRRAGASSCCAGEPELPCPVALLPVVPNNVSVYRTQLPAGGAFVPTPCGRNSREPGAPKWTNRWDLCCPVKPAPAKVLQVGVRMTAAVVRLCSRLSPMVVMVAKCEKADSGEHLGPRRRTFPQSPRALDDRGPDRRPGRNSLHPRLNPNTRTPDHLNARIRTKPCCWQFVQAGYPYMYDNSGDGTSYYHWPEGWPYGGASPRRERPPWRLPLAASPLSAAAWVPCSPVH